MIEQAPKVIRFHPAQMEFLKSNSLFRGFTGGRGAGKSFVGAYDILRRAQPGRLYMIVAPTYPMLNDSSLRSFTAHAETLGLTYSMNRSRFVATLPNRAEILFRSADNPNKLRGPNLSGVWMDEASYIEKEAYEIAIACLREAGEQGWLTATFTPKGRQHWTYQVFGMKADNTSLFRSATRDNVFLPDTFENVIRGQYTTMMAAQELEGEFIEFNAGVFARHWFGIVDAAPAKARRVRYWDKAGTDNGGAYTCGVLMSNTDDGEYFVEHVIRGQLSAHKRNNLILQTSIADREKYGDVEIVVEQEPGSGGKESAEFTIKQLAGFKIFVDRPSGDKVTRAQPYAAQAEAGNVKLLQSAWNGDYLDELSAFPGGEYLDQVDASSGAFNRLALIRKRVFQVWT
jgi:predicted phage terminase large subunit-like protein